MNDREYSRIVTGFTYDGRYLDDCFLVCIHNSLRNLSQRTGIGDFEVSQKEIRSAAHYKPVGYYNLDALIRYLDNIMGPYGYKSRIKSKPDMTLDELLRILSISNCSFPIISVGWNYFLLQNARLKPDSNDPIDHAIIVMEIDPTGQEITIFDPMEKQLCKSSNMSDFHRRLPLPKVIKHWERSVFSPRWCMWFEKRAEQRLLEV